MAQVTSPSGTYPYTSKTIALTLAVRKTQLTWHHLGRCHELHKLKKLEVRGDLAPVLEHHNTAGLSVLTRLTTVHLGSRFP